MSFRFFDLSTMEFIETDFFLVVSPEADTWPDITGTCIAKANPKKLAGCLALSDLS